MAILPTQIPDIEINGHVYSERDWHENPAATISALAADIAAVAPADNRIEWEPSMCGSVLDGGKLRPLPRGYPGFPIGEPLKLPTEPEGLMPGMLYCKDGVLNIAVGEVSDFQLGLQQTGRARARATFNPYDEEHARVLSKEKVREMVEAGELPECALSPTAQVVVLVPRADPELSLERVLPGMEPLIPTRRLLPSEITQFRQEWERAYKSGLISAAEMRRLEGLPPLPPDEGVLVGESPIGTLKRLMDEIDQGLPALNYQTSEERLPIEEPGEPPRWRSVVAYSREWVRTDQPPQRELAPFPAQALRSAPGVAPLLEIPD